MNEAIFCRRQAQLAHDSAADAALENVSSRFRRAAAAWEKLAERAERVAAGREAREAGARSDGLAPPTAGFQDHPGATTASAAGT